jgi:hypothetical protein
MPRTKALDKLTDTQVVALSRFIVLTPSRWRAKLGRAWESGEYPHDSTLNTAALQQIRNKNGVSLIGRLNAAEIHTAAAEVAAAKGTAGAPPQS